MVACGTVEGGYDSGGHRLRAIVTPLGCRGS
jgi:hypothetical protein